MTSIGLTTLFRQASAAAREGDAAAFAGIRASIETLDRMGEVARDDLDLLQVVAAARAGDTELARATLQRLGDLSTGQRSDLVQWLRGAPEFEHARFRDFALELQRLARVPTRRIGLLQSRRLSAALAVLVLAAAGAAYTLIEHFLPQPAPQNIRNLLTGVAGGDGRLVFGALPRSWRESLLEGATRLAQEPADAAQGAALQQSLANLAAALRAVAATRQAPAIALALVGADAPPDTLARLAAGVADIAASAWMNPALWSQRPPWETSLSADAVLAWRVMLRHAPLSLWSDRLFDTGEVIHPLEASEFFVSETSASPGRTTLQVQGRIATWPMTCVQVDGTWVPVDWSDDWPRHRERITRGDASVHPRSQIESELAARINEVASWLTKSATNPEAAALPSKDIAWWIAR
jgi:hypothetical protein